MMLNNPFSHTAAGELGANRETMLQNELLLRVGVILQVLAIWFRDCYFNHIWISIINFTFNKSWTVCLWVITIEISLYFISSAFRLIWKKTSMHASVKQNVQWFHQHCVPEFKYWFHDIFDNWSHILVIKQITNLCKQCLESNSIETYK